MEQIRGELLALAQRRGERDAGEGARRAGRTGTRIVGAHRAGPQRRLARKQDEIAATLFGAGGEAARDGRAGQVAGEQQTAIEQTHVRRRPGDHRVRDELLEQFGRDAAVGSGIEGHAAEARFEHTEEDDAVGDFLLRDGDRGDVALGAVIQRDLRGGVAQLLEAERSADILREQRRELFGGDQQVTQEAERLHRHRRTLRLHDLDFGRGRGRADLGETRRGETALNLIKQTASVGGRLGPEFSP